MSVPAATAIAGSVLTAAFWNAQVRDNVNAHLSTQWLYVDGAALRPDLTNGCNAPTDQTTTAGNPLISGPGFSGTADQFSQFKIALPKRWNASTVQFRVRWNAPSGNTAAGDVVFSLAAVAASDGDSIDASFGTAINVTDTFQAVKKTHKTALSSAVTIAGSPLKEDVIFFRFGRLATNGSDTKTDAIYVEGVELFVTADALNDA